MSKIQWEYDLVERPFCEQLKTMGWQWIELITITITITKCDMENSEMRTSWCKPSERARGKPDGRVMNLQF